MKQLPSAATGARNVQFAVGLTGRDLETLTLAERRSTAQIAAAMSISSNTVRTRVRRLLRKLAVGDRAQAADRARELRFI